MPEFKDITGQKFGNLIAIKLIGTTRSKKKLFQCKCNCGQVKNIQSASLLSGKTKSCGRCKIFSIEGVKKEYLKVIRIEKFGKKFLALCSCVCGKQVYLNHGNFIQNKSCGCRKDKRERRNKSWKGYEEISGKVWGRTKRGAYSRNLEFNITIEYAWDLFLSQNRKCALTSRDLKFESSCLHSDGNASLDRIDSKKGYIIGNLQWVDKTLNLMKMHFPQDYFINTCKEVARNFSQPSGTQEEEQSI